MSHQPATPFPWQADTQPAQHRHTTFPPFSLPALLGRGKSSSRREGEHAGQRKATFIADANIHSAQSRRVDRGAACPSISLSVFCAPQKKGTRKELAEESQAGWCLLATLTRTKSMLLWKSNNEKKKGSAVTAWLHVLLELKLYSSSQVVLGWDRPGVSCTSPESVSNEGRFMSVVLTVIFFCVVLL